jgi:hypothetical protein
MKKWAKPMSEVGKANNEQRGCTSLRYKYTGVNGKEKLAAYYRKLKREERV